MGFRYLQVTFFILALLIGEPRPQAGEIEKASCDFIRSSLSPLLLNPNARVREGEKAIYGTFYPRGKKIPPLSDGVHPFILDSDLNILIAPRFPDLDELHPVVTHRSLLNRLKEVTKKEPKLLGLGEIHVDHGVISSLNNKAGTAFTPFERLEEMKKPLQNAGIPITSETPLVPFNTVQSGHDPEHIAGIFRIQVQKDPVMKRLEDRLLSFRKKIQSQFPDPKSPGKVSWLQFLTSPKNPAFHARGIQEGSDLELELISLLGQLENPLDRYRVIPILLQKHSAQELESILKDLPSFQGYLNR